MVKYKFALTRLWRMPCNRETARIQELVNLSFCDFLAVAPVQIVHKKLCWKLSFST